MQSSMKFLKFTFVLMVFLASCSSKDIPLATVTTIPSESPIQILTKIPTSFPTQSTQKDIIEIKETGDSSKTTNKPNSTISTTTTPFPTLTPYPTFDVKDIKTHVPFSPAKCPASNPDYIIPTDISWETIGSTDLTEIVLNELNNGASFSQAKKDFEKALDFYNFLEMLDLTGDGVPELVVDKVYDFSVIGCDDGNYKAILDYNTIDVAFSSPTIIAVRDMNLNGIPDVVLVYYVSSALETVADILEWDGIQFNSLIQANHGLNSSNTSRLAKSLYWYSYSQPFYDWSKTDNQPLMAGPSNVIIRDMDENGTEELLLIGNGPGGEYNRLILCPCRRKQVVFKWDGIHYLYSSLDMGPPIFRFQAVQDADRFFLDGEYDKALKLYQDAIFSDKLDWWSPEKMFYLRDIYVGNNASTPQVNKDEYPFLAAYSRYRILLNHLVRGWLSDAQVAYNSLTEKFPDGSTGSQFAEMGTILWNEYQASNDLAESCKLVVEYAASHLEILTVLGDTLHGFESHIYVPEDVCPFK